MLSDENISRIADAVAARIQAQNAQEPEIMDVDELAVFLRVNSTWVYKMASQMPHFKVGNRFRFSRKEIHKAISNGSLVPTLGPSPLDC